jgi:hypothetical protein
MYLQFWKYTLAKSAYSFLSRMALKLWVAVELHVQESAGYNWILFFSGAWGGGLHCALSLSWPEAIPPQPSPATGAESLPNHNGNHSAYSSSEKIVLLSFNLVLSKHSLPSLRISFKCNPVMII